MKLRSLLLAATVIAAPLAAMAQPVDGLYVGAGAGYNYLQRTKIHSTAPGAAVAEPFSGKLDGEGGFIGSLSVGYGLGNGLRFEIQGDYRQDHQKLKNSTFSGGDSNTLSYGGYGNALFDFDIGDPMFFPYVGLGVGYRETELQNFRAYPAGSPLGYYSNHHNGGGLSAQGIAGVGIAIPGVPGLSLTAEYRFTGVFENVKLEGSQNLTGVNAATTANVKLNDQYNHSVLFGVRYAFGVTPPPPPPAPVPVAAPIAAPARTYLVFFDWDRADLTARARQIIAEAASNATKVQTTRIEVNGYTDRSGTPAYNQKLSVRRADSVAAELVRDGIPRNEIVTMGFGESHPLVPTAAGVREPQNRRVEIILK